MRGNEGQPDLLLQGPEVLQIRPRGNIQVIPLPSFIITVAKSRSGFTAVSAKKKQLKHVDRNVRQFLKLVLLLFSAIRNVFF